ncbi:MAG: preprotein translocase subunit SecE [Gammaproteobacteria bacterium]
MNSKVDTGSVKLDSVKLVMALLIVSSVITAFYFYAEHSLLLRVLGLLAGSGVALVIAMQTEKGHQIWAFFQDAQIEVRKVVWPTRQETLQTTLIVILMVVFVAIILWILDMFLGWSIGLLMGQGG